MLRFSASSITLSEDFSRGDTAIRKRDRANDNEGSFARASCRVKRNVDRIPIYTPVFWGKAPENDYTRGDDGLRLPYVGQWNGALLLLVDEPSLFPTVGFCLGRLCIVAAFQLCIPANARDFCLPRMPLDIRARDGSSFPRARGNGARVAPLSVDYNGDHHRSFPAFPSCGTIIRDLCELFGDSLFALDLKGDS